MVSTYAMASSSAAPRLRLVHFNDIYELANLPRVQTFLSQVQPDATVLSGDFLSPSTLSSVDGGKGMIRTLRAIGLTHCSLGNHEADLKLPALHRRLDRLSQATTILNSNIGRNLHPQDQKLEKFIPDWMIHSDWMPEYSIISTPCKRIQVALAGFMSDEPGVFPTGTFRGVPIGSVTETYSKLYADLVATHAVHMILPLTHQFIQRDKELAQHMLQVSQQSQNGLILGGHEHTPYDEIVTHNDKQVRILKSGMDANAVNLIDLTFDPETGQLVELQADLVEMRTMEPSVVVSGMVEEYMKVLRDLETEDVIRADAWLPAGTPLSSVGTRYQQTTVGALLSLALKDELEVDAAMINGATIKGNTLYAGTSMSYAALKQELPFPTKIVVVPMKRWELQEAITYSRTKNPDWTSAEEDDPSAVERKGYLQVDMEFDRSGFDTGDPDDELMVALPRNLLNGFCRIQPLMDLGERLKKEGRFPDEDTYIKAIDVIVRHFCKEQWFEMASEVHNFDELDQDHKGFLSRDDVQRLLRDKLGHEPADFVVDNMIAAIDNDCNGVIDPGEFSHLLADMERQHGLFRLD